MGKPLNAGTKVEIEVGEHKGKKGTYLYHCCGGHKIKLEDGTFAYYHNPSHFSAIRKYDILKCTRNRFCCWRYTWKYQFLSIDKSLPVISTF